MKFFFAGQDFNWPQETNVLVLNPRPWNDWFEFRTLFSLIYIDADLNRSVVGMVKIADLTHEYRNEPGGGTQLPNAFEHLDLARYVSLGQDEEYYDTLRSTFGPVVSRSILQAMGDLAENPNRLEELREHNVVTQSLMRGIAPVTVTGKFNRIVTMGGGLAAYDFTFRRPSESPIPAPPVELTFAVTPGSAPPTNVHVLIGRNGSGKTTLLRSMARSMLGTTVAIDTDGTFTSNEGGQLDIANLVYVAFSAFDESVLPVLDKELQYDIAYSYVGLQYIPNLAEPSDGHEQPEPLGAVKQTRPPSELAGELARSARAVLQKNLRGVWLKALLTLESDPNFAEAEVSNLASETSTAGTIAEEARQIYGRLSSGHKIVLLTITRLVETVTERTMVLMDEPEGHLHPPLLSALIRALSDLLQARNGVAIIATHSPVILQEVPETAAWKVRRVGTSQVSERLGIETFGESVGVLTSEVFSLELTDSGFHRLLTEAALELGSYDAVVDHFGGRLGFEARASLRAWFATQSA